MSGRHASPPAWAERLVAALVPDRDAEFFLGDLEQEFRERASRHAARARLWYWSQALWGALRLFLHAPRSPRSSRPHGDGAMTSLLKDLRYGWRILIRRPLFTLTAVVTLALGIGATTAVFSVVNPVLLSPLPYPESGRVVMVWQYDPDGGPGTVGYATFADLQRDSKTLESAAAMAYWTPVLTGETEPERVIGQSVTAGFFGVLGVHPALGRDFRPEEDTRGNNHVAILSHALWQRRFGADTGIVGQTVTLSGTPYLVVGVLPAGFESLIEPTAQIWRPLGYEASLPWACRTCQHLRMAARLRPGVEAARATGELDQLLKRYGRQYPDDYVHPGALAVPLHDDLVKRVRPALFLVLGAAAFVLLIATANVANLMLGQAARREHEFAVRAALGAGRGSLLRQLVTESLLIGGIGGLAGIALAWWGVKALVALGPAEIPRLSAVNLDFTALGFAVGLSLVCGLILGIVPARDLWHRGIGGRLRGGGRAGAGQARRRLRTGLVAAEVALALMLLASAGLLLRSVRGLLSVDPGVDPANLLTMELVASGPDYSEDESVRVMNARVLDTVRALPGVVSAGFASQIPLGGNYDTYGVRIEGRPPRPEEAIDADRYAASPGYLASMGIRLLAGRDFTPDDREGAEPVVLVNDVLARLAWPGENPIGKRIAMGSLDSPWRQVVGVVNTVHHTALDAPEMPQFYAPLAQWPWADNALALVVKTRSASPAAMVSQVREAIWSVDKDLPVSHIATMAELVSRSASQRRFAMILFQLFALTAMVLSAVGIYGVLAGSVEERTREIGIRAALGADRNRLLSLVVREGMAAALAGLAVGAVGALLLGRLLQGLLYGVSPHDLPTLGTTAVILALVALTACLAPAWRAARVEPMEVLRGE
ncbi:MAG: ABC transporter permease [Gemmatimonadales bacterium]